jgi:hypothetical protein
MFRFTIRDVLWLMVVVALLALWATERRWRSFDWPRIQRNEAARDAEMARQYATIQNLKSRLATEYGRRIDAERRLAEAEAASLEQASQGVAKSNFVP